jgi:hypothetical protein
VGSIRSSVTVVVMVRNSRSRRKEGSHPGDTKVLPFVHNAISVDFSNHLHFECEGEGPEKVVLGRMTKWLDKVSSSSIHHL